MNPRVLVVVHVPRTIETWLLHSDDCLTLHHAAYWVSLRGKPSVDNSENVTVEVPLAQKFTILQLNWLMNLLANGDKP